MTEVAKLSFSRAFEILLPGNCHQFLAQINFYKNLSTGLDIPYIKSYDIVFETKISKILGALKRRRSRLDTGVLQEKLYEAVAQGSLCGLVQV